MALFTLDGLSPRVPANGRYWIAPDAIVIGNVEIAEEASVWFGSVVRGDNEPIRIGARSNVQDGCVLHTDPGFPLTVGEDCTIGHMVMLHGCSIGRGSLVGIGSIILNGTVVGEECLIGAHTLLPEGKVIPPRSMVLGSPGKIVRTLSAEEAAKYGAAAGRYVMNWQRFARGLTRADEAEGTGQCISGSRAAAG